jgi:hypothetical protein
MTDSLVPTPSSPLLLETKTTTTTTTNLRQIPTDRDQRKRKTSIIFPYEETRRRKHELSAAFVEEKEAQKQRWRSQPVSELRDLQSLPRPPRAAATLDEERMKTTSL